MSQLYVHHNQVKQGNESLEVAFPMVKDYYCFDSYKALVHLFQNIASLKKMNGRAHYHLIENLKFGKKALKQTIWIWTMTYLSQAYLNTIIKQSVKSIRMSCILSIVKVKKSCKSRR